MEYNGGVPEWPYNGFVGQYDDRSWQYARYAVGDQGRVGGDRPVRRERRARSRQATQTAGGPRRARRTTRWSSRC